MPTTVDQMLRKALAQLKADRDKLDRRIGAIESALSGDEAGRPATAGPRSAGTGGRKRMSDVARKRIARKLKAYWAKRKASASKGAVKTTGAKAAK
jgi:hypothetical protein